MQKSGCLQYIAYCNNWLLTMQPLCASLRRVGGLSMSEQNDGLRAAAAYPKVGVFQVRAPMGRTTPKQDT